MARSGLNGAKSCPWCHSLRLWLWDKGVPGKFAVACSNPSCTATGPIAPDVETAVMLWNEPPRSYHEPHSRLRMSERVDNLLGEMADERQINEEARPSGRDFGPASKDD